MRRRNVWLACVFAALPVGAESTRSPRISVANTTSPISISDQLHSIYSIAWHRRSSRAGRCDGATAGSGRTSSRRRRASASGSRCARYTMTSTRADLIMRSQPTGLSDEEIVNLPGARENLHRQPEATQSQSQSQSQPDSVQASHILIKHAGSRRPSSWKEVHSPE